MKTVTNWLVILHTCVYMLIYYGTSPTSSAYSKALDFPDVLTGIVKAATPAAAFVSTFFYNFTLGKKYLPAYIISWICLIVGSFFYYAALTVHSVPLLVAGRILFGWGGGKVITRAYFATEINPKNKALWSGILVASIAFSLTGGPGISAFFEFIPDFDILFLKTRTYNFFAGVFTLIALISSIIFFVLFQDKKSDDNKIVVPFPVIGKEGEEAEPRKIL